MKRIVTILLCLCLLLGLTVPAFAEETEEPQEGTKVEFLLQPTSAQIVVSRGIGYTYVEDTVEGTSLPEVDAVRRTFLLKEGNYTATITDRDCYASSFSFCVTEAGKVTSVGTGDSNINAYLKDGCFTITLSAFVPSEIEGAWDGRTLDVSWYDEESEALFISAPAQLAGMAAIVNGIYNAEIDLILDDADGDGTTESYTPVQYAALENRKIRAKSSTGETGGAYGNNLVTGDAYWYGIKRDDATRADFRGQRVYLTADLDMGGYQKDGKWTGARYMTVGGQSLMHYIDYAAERSDGLSHLGASFNGTLDGQGHYISNLYCDRYAAGTNYGDSQSVGLVGRLGNHDNDDTALAAVNPTVRRISVSGYVYGRRSVGGIVGKIGQTTASRLADGTVGGIVEQCMNYAEVRNTDAKGCGGIVGAGWNKGRVSSCANFGDISSTYNCPTGGIVGSNEIKIVNCYNVGHISAASDRYAMAIGTNNGGASYVTNCYYLDGAASGGGYYSSNKGANARTEAEMKTAEFLAALNGDTRDWVFSGEGGYPVLRCFTEDTTGLLSVEKTADPQRSDYVVGQSFDPEGLALWANYSDATRQRITDFNITPSRPLTAADTEVTISGSFEGLDYSYTYPITVIEAELLRIGIKQQPNSLLYASDETFSPEGMVVSAYFSSLPTKPVAVEDYTCEVAGDTVTVRYTYGGKTEETTLTLTLLDTPAPVNGQDGFYPLRNENDLLWFANRVNAYEKVSAKGRLEDDITLTAPYLGLGTVKNRFAGTLDGGGHTLTLHCAFAQDAVGVIAYAGDATVTDLTVGGSLSGSGSVGTGAFAGIVTNGTLTLERCVNRAEVGGGNYVGGLVGKVLTGGILRLTDCENAAAVSGGSYVGGIAAMAGGGSTFISCKNSGAVTAGGAYAGGILSHAQVTPGQEPLILRDCGNLASVSGGESVGGIVGYTNGSSTDSAVQLRQCFNEAAVSGLSAVGGIIGCSFHASDCVERCFNVGAITASGATARKGAGGIVGYCKASLTDVYNLGTVTAPAAAGGLVGAAAQTNAVIENAYSTDTAPLIGVVSADMRAENCYTLVGTPAPEIGLNRRLSGEIKTVEADELELAALGAAFRDSDICPLRYPVLIWQTGAAHTPLIDPAVAPTKETAGRTEGSHCSVCGKVLVRQREIPPLDDMPTDDPAAAFKDLQRGKWYYDGVNDLLRRGLMKGVGNDSFDPDGTVTRAQLVTILYRMEGAPDMTGHKLPFADVPASRWYTDAVTWAAENGVVNGVGSGRFDPDGPVTREQIATILFRYTHAQEAADTLNTFPDGGTVSAFARPAMRWAVASGLIGGTKLDGTVYLDPLSGATRAQIAVMLSRYFGKE